MNIDLDAFPDTIAELQRIANAGAGAVHAPAGVSARVIRQARIQRTRLRLVQAGAGTLVIGVLAAGALIGNSRYFEFVMPSENMSPTIQVGEIVTIDKSRTPVVGDVVLVRIDGPNGQQAQVLYRYAADDLHRLPGVEVSVPGAAYDYSTVGSATSDTTTIQHHPITPGVGYLIAPGAAYLLGDNTRMAHDSRYFGALPKSRILGVAISVRTPGGDERAISGSTAQPGTEGAQVDPPSDLPTAWSISR